MPSELAHAHHNHVLRPARFLTGRRAVQIAHFLMTRIEVGVDHKIGEARNRREHLIQIGISAEIARSNRGDQQITQTPHCRGQRRCVRQLLLQQIGKV